MLTPGEWRLRKSNGRIVESFDGRKVLTAERTVHAGDAFDNARLAVCAKDMYALLQDVHRFTSEFGGPKVDVLNARIVEVVKKVTGEADDNK